MAFTSVNCATLYSTSAIVIPTIRTAVFSSPTILGQIVISSIVGNFTSYTITRNGGAESASQTAATYTDTSLTNNTQYTYTIVPYIGGIKGVAFTTMTNPNNAGTPGKIYTLATITGLNPTYSGANSTISSVYITWASNGYTSILLANTTKAGANYTGVGTAYNSTTNGSSDSALTTNAQYTYTFTTRNGDAYYVANSNCQTTVNTCTWAAITAAAFSSPSALLSITIGSITGTYTSFNVYRGGASIAAAQTGTSYTNSGLVNNTTYTYSLYPINALSYASTTAFTSITNPNNAGTPGSIYTLATVAGLNPTYSGANSTISTVYITWTSIGYTSILLANTTKAGANYTGSGTAYNSNVNGSSDNALTTNTQYTYTFSTRNGDSFYVANSNCQTTVNTCTWASVNAPTFSTITATGVTVAVGGTYTNAVVTYTGGIGGSPASGTSIAYATLSAGQAYSTFTSGSNVVFVAAPLNALGYQSTNTSTATQQLTQAASFSSALFTTPTYTYNAGATVTWTNSIASMGISTGGKVIVYSTGWGASSSTRNPTTVWMNNGNFGKTFSSINSKLASFQANAYMNILLGIGVSNDGTIIILYMNSYNTGGAASATNGPGFYVSTNSGATFGGLYSSTGTTASLSPGPCQVVISADNNWAYSSGSGVYQNCFCVNKTAGNFTTWNSYYYDQQTVAKYGPQGSIMAMNSDASIMYFSGGQGNFAMCKSTTKGATVTGMTTEITTVAGAGYQASFIACNSTGSIIYASVHNWSTTSFLLKSINSGSTFTKLTMPVLNMCIQGIVCNSDGTNVLILYGGAMTSGNPFAGPGINPSTTSSIYISTNGGGSWTAAGGPNAYNPQLTSGVAVDSTFTVFGLMIATNKSNLNMVCNTGFGNGYFYG
jgi:hypothetical protein